MLKALRSSSCCYCKSIQTRLTLTVHWDGKLMPDLTGRDNVDRLPILVSTMGETKLLGIIIIIII